MGGLCIDKSNELVVPVFLLYHDEAIKMNIDCLTNNLKRVIAPERAVETLCPQ